LSTLDCTAPLSPCQGRLISFRDDDDDDDDDDNDDDVYINWK